MEDRGILTMQCCLEEIPEGDEPLKVALWHLNMWIQIYDLPSGFMSEVVGI